MEPSQSLRPGLSRPLQLVWVGSTNGRCARLLDCIEIACQQLGWAWRLTVIDRDSPTAGEELNHHLALADRLLFVYENRYDYPHQLIHYVQSQSVIVPWGVVTGLWQTGSRRTGIGLTNYWQLPWYRWWDGWCEWFFPEYARRAAWCVSQFDPLILPVDLAGSAVHVSGSPRSIPNSQVLVLAACSVSGESWQLSARRAGWQATCVHPRRLRALMEDRLQPQLIVWDDSCLDALPGERVGMQQALDQCQQLSERYPEVPMVAGVQQACLAEWCTSKPKDQPLGSAWDWMIKPSHSLPLANRLIWLERGQQMKTASA